MDVSHVFEEIEKFVNVYKLKIEEEKEEIAESERKLSYFRNAFSEKTPSSSVLTTLFKDEEPEGFVFSKYEEKRKQLAAQRRAEYNAYLEKKEAERISKRRLHQEQKDISPKSILDSVDYERVLAKRKEEEARFRNVNVADSVHHSQPILNGDVRKSDLNTPSTSAHVSPRTRSSSVSIPNGNLSIAASVSDSTNSRYPESEGRKGIEALDEETLKLLEERITKRMEEEKRQMLREFEKELRRNNLKEEVQSFKSTTSEKSSQGHKSSNSEKSSPQRSARSEGYPNFGITGGGGEPIRDSNGNLLAMRGQRRRSSTDYGSVLSFPSMQQRSEKEKEALYKEELRKQIEEQKRLKALERARALEEEERLNQRIEEQRRKEQEEIENERKSANKTKEQLQRQNERLRMLEEFRRKDAEARRRRTPETKAPSPVPQPPVVQERSNSPPIPAVRTKTLLDKHAEMCAKVIDPDKPFSSLARLRKSINEDQQKSKNNLKNSYEVMNRRTIQEISDDDDDDEDIFRTSTKF